jgi:hypothetical protein
LLVDILKKLINEVREGLPIGEFAIVPDTGSAAAQVRSACA